MGKDMVVPTTEDAALSALPLLFEKLDVLSASVAWPDPPAPGSALAMDDRRWSWWRLSSVVQAKLTSVSDHLRAVRVHSEAENFHPMATYTLTRAALLSASQAVWLLCDENPLVRQRRGVFVADEVERRRCEALKTAVEGREVTWHKSAITRVHIEMRRRGLELARVDLPKPGPTKETDIIRLASEAVQPDSLRWQKQAMYQWQTSSSDAHGAMWGSLTRGATTLQQPSDGLAVLGIGGSPLQAWRHVYVPLMTAKWAVERTTKLATAPHQHEAAVPSDFEKESD